MARLIVHQERIPDHQETDEYLSLWSTGRTGRKGCCKCQPVRCAAFVLKRVLRAQWNM